MKSGALPIVVGISGASGAIYGIRLLEALRQEGVETHLVVSRTAQITLAHETATSLAQAEALAHASYAPGDLAARVSSGSFRTAGMIVAPCSMKTLAEIASGVTATLLSRAADVTLKERRRLVLAVRETPLTSVHLRNMLSVSDMGGIIAPPVPAFYVQPQNVDDIVNHSVGRLLDLFDIEHALVKRWRGIDEPPQSQTN